jgi:arylsulfatase A-like enzyme
LTPMAIQVPGFNNGGKHCKRTVSSIALFPTLVDYCKLEAPEHKLEGRSLRPLLENPKAMWDRPALTTYGEKYASVRDEHYRYIRYPDGTEELYDHQNDPHELNNLASDSAFNVVKKHLAKRIPNTWAKSLGGRMG